MSGADQVQRGIRTRRALLAVARLCLERRCPLPTHVAIARIVGIDASQIANHWSRMEEAGQVERVRVGTKHGVRYRVRSVGA